MLIKYIKSVHWRVAKCLSYIEEARCLKVKGLDRPGGFQEAEALKFQDSRHVKVVRLSALRTGRLYTPGNISGTHLCQRLSQPQDHSAAGRNMSMKIPRAPSGIEPATFRLAQPTAPPRTPTCIFDSDIYWINLTLFTISTIVLYTHVYPQLIAHSFLLLLRVSAANIARIQGATSVEDNYNVL